MQAELIGEIRFIDGPKELSVYRKQKGLYTTWLKVGAALLEIKADDIDDIITCLIEAKEIILQEQEIENEQ